MFGSLFGKKEVAPASIRETLFGDMPLDQWPAGGDPADGFPWGAFVSARNCVAAGDRAGAIEWWRRILAQSDLEPRMYLQAWHFLRQHGQGPPPDVAKQLLGVVIEVQMPEGLDLLAAYPDYSARYYNYSGAGVVWEHPDTSLDSAIEQLLELSRQVVAQIGPWEDARPAAPPTDHMRMSFLTPSGLHFGQGPMDVLASDPIGSGVVQASINLMQAMVEKGGGHAP